MSPVTEQDERRSRRRFALLWIASLVVAVALAAGVVVALDRNDSTSTNAQVDGGGSGTAPVLADPPADLDLPEHDRSTSTATPHPSREVLTTTYEGGSVIVPNPGASGGAALGAPRTHGVNLVLTSTLNAPLRPGRERTLYVKVRNPNPFPVDVFRIDVRVDEPPALGCLAEWVRTGHYRYSGGTPRRIAGSSSVVMNLPIELIDLVDVDQNACQNTYFPLRLSGVAVDVE